MAHYKNRRPKSFKGCCVLCSFRTTNGKRNGRLLTRAERRAELDAQEQLDELEQTYQRDKRSKSKSRWIGDELDRGIVYPNWTKSKKELGL